MTDDTPKPAEPVREWWMHEALIGPKTGQRYPATVESSPVAGYIHVIEHSALIRNIHEHNEAMNNTIRMYEAKLAQAIAERDQALRTIAPVHAEVERLRAALERIASYRKAILAKEFERDSISLIGTFNLIRDALSGAKSSSESADEI